MELESKPISSPARMIGVNLQTHSKECPRGPSKGVDLAVGILCLICLFAAMAVSDLDGGYLISARVNSVIRQVVIFGERLAARPGATTESALTIMVAENDNRQRLITKTTLERHGYSVVLADNDSEMLSIFRKFAPRVALVILNRSALRHSTQDVIGRLKLIRPDIPILLFPPPADGRRPGSSLTDSPARLAETVRKALS